MHCIVTAGPTYEPLDNVRRLTNFSTGRLGTELANHLAAAGHEVTLLLGEQATHAGLVRGAQVERFTTTVDLLERLRALAQRDVRAVFHAAAVSDFRFGKVWAQSADGGRAEIQSGKFSTRQGGLLAELIPTPKILGQLRDHFPAAQIVGWKYEVDGDRASVLAAAASQLAESRTDLCVANGPAYGLGFGVVRPGADCAHQPDAAALFETLAGLLSRPTAS